MDEKKKDVILLRLYGPTSSDEERFYEYPLPKEATHESHAAESR